jgi:uncharacterized protein
MKLLKTSLLLSLILFQIVKAGTEPQKTTKIDFKAKEFELAQVTLLDGPFKDAMNRDIAWLKMLDMERLLSSFRLVAGLPSTVQPYGGWEATDAKFDGIRGHYLGHYLSACAKAYACTKDKEIKKRIDYLVTELAKCQKQYGNGYIGAFPEKLFDDLIQGQKVSWVPWYTMHKIFAGLYDVYNYTGNAEVYAVLLKLTDWARKKTDGLSAESLQNMLKTEHGGMTETLADLYAITQKPEHLALAKRFDHKMLLESMASGKDNLTGLHANTQIPKMIGAAREYEVTAEPVYMKAAEFFWECVVNHRTTATGGHSIYEHFKEPDVLAAYLNSAHANETCNAYNMLKLTAHLYDWTGNIRYADFYERTLINCILASQCPVKYEKEPAGMMSYHQPIKPGLWKRLNDKENSFWCCTGTGSENHVQYGKLIYAYDNEGLIINFFVASQLSWDEKKMTVKQETNFPESDYSKITVESSEKPQKMKIRIRVPWWANKGVQVKINGKVQNISATPSSYITLEKIWFNKDIIEVTMPMALYKEGLPDKKNIVAFLYGPMVLSGQLGKSGLTLETLYGINGKEYLDQFKLDSIAVPHFENVDEDLNSWIKPVLGKPLTFQTTGKGVPNDVTLIPYFKQFLERYSIYWEIK